MENCLVKRLKGVVENTTLPKLGELFIVVKRNNDLVKIRVNHGDGHKGGIARIVSGTGSFTDSEGTFHVQSIELNADVSTELIVETNTDVVIAIPNKYYLTYLGPSNDSVITTQELNRSLIVKADDMKYANLDNIEHFTVNVDGEFDISAINENCVIISNIYFSSLSGKDLYGDATKFIRNLSGNYYGGLREFFLDNKMIGDMSYFNGTVGQMQGVYNIRKDIIMPWKGTRPSDKMIIAFPNGSWNFGNDLDAMLINQANCTPNPSSGDPENAKIYVRGNRTSASDSAVASLKEMGYSIQVNDITL